MGVKIGTTDLLESYIGGDSGGYYLYRPLISDATDESGNGRDGTIYGTVTWNDGAVFAGSGQISSPLNSMPSDFTISCWVYKTQNSTAAQTLFAKWGSYLERGRFGMYYDGSGNLYVRNVPSESESRALVGNYGYNTWDNVVYVKNGLNIYVYVNGSLATMVSYYAWDDDARYYLGIGGWTPSERNFNGVIKDFIVDNKVWASQEVLDYYNQTNSNY